MAWFLLFCFSSYMSRICPQQSHDSARAIPVLSEHHNKVFLTEQVSTSGDLDPGSSEYKGSAQHPCRIDACSCAHPIHVMGLATLPGFTVSWHSPAAASAANACRYNTLSSCPAQKSSCQGAPLQPLASMLKVAVGAICCCVRKVK